MQAAICTGLPRLCGYTKQALCRASGLVLLMPCWLALASRQQQSKPCRAQQLTWIWPNSSCRSLMACRASTRSALVSPMPIRMPEVYGT